MAADAKSYAAFGGVLDRVVEEVAHDLPYPALVSEEMLRDRLVDLERKFQLLLVDHLVMALLEIFQQLPQMIIALVEFHLAGLDLRYVENVVDDREQVIAGSSDIKRGLTNLGVVAVFQYDLVHAQDRIHWSSYLV